MDCRLAWKRSVLWLVVGAVTLVLGFIVIIAGALMLASQALAPAGPAVMIVGYFLFFVGLLIVMASMVMFLVTGIFCAPISLFDVLDPSTGFAFSPGAPRPNLISLLGCLFCGCGNRPAKAPGGVGGVPVPPTFEELFEQAHGMVKNAQALFDQARERVEQFRRDAEAALEQEVPEEERERLRDMKEELDRQAERMAKGAKEASATAGRYASEFFGRL